MLRSEFNIEGKYSARRYRGVGESNKKTGQKTIEKCEMGRNAPKVVLAPNSSWIVSAVFPGDATASRSSRLTRTVNLGENSPSGDDFNKPNNKNLKVDATNVVRARVSA